MTGLPIEGVHTIPCRLNGPRGVVKAFLIEGDGELLLVDTGFSDEDGNLILEAVKALGKDTREMRSCVLTHRHRDHIGGLKRLQATVRMRTLAHSADAPEIESALGITIDETLQDNQVLEHFDGLRVLHLPGHTPGSIALHIPWARTLIAGDVMMSSGGWLDVAPPYLSDDPAQSIESIRKLVGLDLDIDRVLVSHGEDVDTDGKRSIGLITGKK